MTDTRHEHLDIGHPAPQRHDIALAGTAFTLGAAPTAWLVQLLAAFAATSYLCDPGQPHPIVQTVPGWLQPAVSAINILALAIAVAGMATGFVLYRRTAHEHRERSGGVLEVGEGRTRFLVTFGTFSSAAFGIAILANTFSLFVMPLCRI
jgi:hypothetical protein